MELESKRMSDYLLDLPEICLTDKNMMELSHKLLRNSENEIEVAQNAFLFVRDHIDHSWDIQASEVTKTSVEVLNSGHGICYAKANLLTGLLRGAGIPTGYCYQKLLLFDEVEKRHCIHALNAVYLQSLKRWFRIDARGNKAGINAQFSLKEEHLAFVVNSECGEQESNIIFVKPNRKTMEVLTKNSNALKMYVNDLPDSL